MGNLALAGATSGTITLTPTAVAGTNTITLPAATGTVVVTGSSPTLGTVTASTITSPAATALTIQSAGTTAMTVDTSQNVGIGISPSYKLDISTASASNGLGINLTNSGSTGAGINFNQSGVDSFFLSMPAGTGGLKFVASGTNERMRIDSSGNLLVGRTDNPNTFRQQLYSPSGNGLQINSGANAINFYYGTNTSISGQVAISSTTASYVTSSDYRLKNSVEPMTTGLATVSALKPVTYKWNADNSDGEGFIAHEIQAIIPHAVTGEKDAVNEDGSIKSQGVDYSKIVVHLVAAIQELTARLAALEVK
jgi:hypothetical protein